MNVQKVCKDSKKNMYFTFTRTLNRTPFKETT